MASWPQSLRTAVDLCLGSAFPCLVWWGPILIQLYNDAAVPSEVVDAATRGERQSDFETVFLREVKKVHLVWLKDDSASVDGRRLGGHQIQECPATSAPPGHA